MALVGRGLPDLMSVSMATGHLTWPDAETTYFWAAILAPHWASFLWTIFSSSGLALDLTTPEMEPPLATGPPTYWAWAAPRASAKAETIKVDFMEYLRIGES